MQPSFENYKFLNVVFDNLTTELEERLAEDEWEWWTIKAIDGVDYAVYVKETTTNKG